MTLTGNVTTGFLSKAIIGTGKTVIDGIIASNVTITQGTLNINAGKTLITQSDNLNITNSFENNGTLVTYGNLNNLTTLNNTNGTVQVAMNKELNVTDDFTLNGTLDLNDQILNMQEQGEETPVYSTLMVNKLKGTGDLLIDANVNETNNNADKIAFSAVDNAVINLTNINVREGFLIHTTEAKDNYLTVLNGNEATFNVGESGTGTSTQFGNYLYTFTKGTEYGKLKVVETYNTTTLIDYITGTEAGLKLNTYSFADNETLDFAITTGFVSGEGNPYTIGMNGKILTGVGTNSGITIKSGDTLTINGGGGTISGFDTALINNGTLVLNNVNFENISSNINGGAIYNEGNISLVAITSNIEFRNNSTAIYNAGGIVNLSVSEGASIIFNDKIKSKSQQSGGVFYINKDISSPGEIVLNADMSECVDSIHFWGGTIKVGKKGTLFNSEITFYNSSTIDIANSKIEKYNFDYMSFDSSKFVTLNLIVDADLKNRKMDTISGEYFDNKGKINIEKINILEDSLANKTEILFTSSTVLKDKITSINTASSKLYTYDVQYNQMRGSLIFINPNAPIINPVILESVIASNVGGYVTQSMIINQAFTSIDNQLNKTRNIKKVSKLSNLYASTSNQIFESSNKIENGLWIRPYSVQETVKFNEIDVDNATVGTLAGLDLAMGESSLVSFYLGYAGSNQKYENIKVNQTGYIVGATGMLIKEKWYAGITANINFNKAESESDYGTDCFDMNMYSIGTKVGYNCEINDKWILEPNLMLMYGTINNQEYETTQEAKIDGQSISNILIEPQVKAKLGLPNGWQPYGLLGYVANISDKGKVVADETEFETDKINGYVEYGAGINKEFINTHWSCYAQITGRSGGRNGFSGNLGIKYNF